MSDSSEEEERETVPLKVRDVMVREVISLDENSTARQAVDIMNEFQIGSIIVTREGKAVGIVTERDFLRRVIGGDKDAKATKVKEIMTAPLVIVNPDADLEEAIKLMFEKKTKKLVVVDGNKLVGLVTLTDIARFEPQMIRILKQLATRQTMPRHIQKVIDFYVV